MKLQPYPAHIVLIIILFVINYLPAQVILSEIMYDVPGSDAHDEFIELFNISYTDTVDLSNWSISDSLAVDELTDYGFGMMIFPRQYAVILDGSYHGNSSTYDHIIPETALKITIDDNALGSGGLTNSSAKTIELINDRDSIVQRYRYTVGNTSGYSDEKIVLSENNSYDNWGNSTELYGTPGYRNTITPVNIDPALESGAISYLPSIGLKTNQQVEFTISVINKGLESFSDSLTIQFYIDRDLDDQFSSGDTLLYRQSSFQLMQPQAQIQFVVDWIPKTAGSYIFILQIAANLDQNISNNIAKEKIYVLESLKTLCINEIKFLTNENEPEWIEIYNFGGQPLLLRDWGLADLKDTTWINQTASIQPQDYVVIAADSSIYSSYEFSEINNILIEPLPTFNNNEDVLFLINPAGGWIDQVPYEISWLEGEEWRNPSLEKIHYNMNSQIPSSWGPSVSPKHATPGEKNSIFTEIKPQQTIVNIEPNPFSPDGDAWEDHTVIQVTAPVMSGRIRAEIFDILGRKIRLLSADSYTGSHYSLVWNGRDDQGQFVRMGLYIIWIQVLDDRNGVIVEAKETIAVAKK